MSQECNWNFDKPLRSIEYVEDINIEFTDRESESELSETESDMAFIASQDDYIELASQGAWS
jgi:hypothetical protein